MRLLFATLVICLSPQMVAATSIKEAPWAPVAAAYRLTIFLGNLTPVPWQKISSSWDAPIAAASSGRPALHYLDTADRAAVRTALAAKDRQKLFAASTGSVVHGIFARLKATEAAIGSGDPSAPLHEAQSLYRSFQDGIAASDPDAARTLGISWLEMTTSIGSAGVLGAGQKRPDIERFARARSTVETYLRANYLPANYLERGHLSPLPESALLAGKTVSLPDTLPPGSNIADQNALPRLVLQFEERGIDEADLPLVAFGDMLFDSPEIFGGPAKALGLACSTCHNRSDVNRDFFIPGLSHRPGGMDVDGAFFNPMFNDREDDHLDTPSLRGIRFTAPYGRDGREASLRRFTRNVIVTEFAGPEPTPFMLDALIAYMRAFDFLPNPQIDRLGGLTELASDAARRGANLFNQPFAGMGGKSCAGCHTPERKFRDGLTHDIGSSETPFPGGSATQFDTPTLLNANFSAPYFHDGSLPTLASVVDWFNNTKSLGLDPAQRGDLTAYLQAVGDGEEPYQRFDGHETAFRLAFDELTTFASTLETLLPIRDRKNIALLVDTVAPDLSADASTMANLSAKSDVYRLAETLRAVGDAAAEGRWADAGLHWTAFKSLQTKFDARMY